MQTSPYKIIKSDKLLIVSIVLPVIFLFEYIGTTYFNIYGDDLSQNKDIIFYGHNIFFYLLIISAGIFIPLFVYRFRSIRDHLENGTEITGKIVSMKRFKDQCKMEFSYVFNSQNIIAKSTMSLTKKVKTYQAGQDIALIVSNLDNKKAFIKELFV